MKSHISATIDGELLQQAKKHARQSRRSLSNVIELGLAKLLAEAPSSPTVVTSQGRFVGSFNRGDSYKGR